jgi:hypothetical protein
MVEEMNHSEEEVEVEILEAKVEHRLKKEELETK